MGTGTEDTTKSLVLYPWNPQQTFLYFHTPLIFEDSKHSHLDSTLNPNDSAWLLPGDAPTRKFCQAREKWRASRREIFGDNRQIGGGDDYSWEKTWGSSDHQIATNF